MHLTAYSTFYSEYIFLVPTQCELPPLSINKASIFIPLNSSASWCTVMLHLHPRPSQWSPSQLGWRCRVPLLSRALRSAPECRYSGCSLARSLVVGLLSGIAERESTSYICVSSIKCMFVFHRFVKSENSPPSWCQTPSRQPRWPRGGSAGSRWGPYIHPALCPMWGTDMSRNAGTSCTSQWRCRSGWTMWG